MKEVKLYIPLNLNGGAAVPEEDLRYIEQNVVARFGACTLHLPLVGVWTNVAGVSYRDSVMIIAVVVEDCRELLDHFRSIALLVLERLEQEAVFLTIQDIGVLSVEPIALVAR